MQNKVVNFLMNKISQNNEIDNIKYEEIRYGLLGLYTLITKTSLIIILSLILGIFKEFMIFLAFYIPLRSVGYGTHASSNIHCWIFSTILLLGVPYIFSLIHLSRIAKIIIWSICFICFVLFCPADTEKRPMINKRRKLKFKFAILVIDILFLVILLKFNSISNYVISAMILQAFLSSPLGYISMGQQVRFRLNDIFKLN